MKKEALFMLVEDNEADIALTLDAFREAGMDNEIKVCQNGQKALDYLFGKDDIDDRENSPLPDLILLDLKMPGLDGHDVLKQIKSADILKRIPVIILTSSKEEGDRALSYDIGANSYLIKPVTFDGFVEVARTVGNYWITLNVKPPIPR